MFIANWLVHLLWRRGSDPDNSAIPYLTAVGDLLGTVLLALAFFVLTLLSGLMAGHHKVKVIYYKTLKLFLLHRIAKADLISIQPVKN